MSFEIVLASNRSIIKAWLEPGKLTSCEEDFYLLALFDLTILQKVFSHKDVKFK